MEKIFFLIFAFVAVISAGCVVGFRNPVHSALALIVSFLQVAAIFILLRSPFLAAAQVFIYIGAVMVLFLFVVMMLNIKKVELETFPLRSKWFAYILIPVITVEFFMAIFGSGIEGIAVSGTEVSVEVIGKELFTRYLFPFEIISVLLLVAMVGAIVMAKKRWRQG